MFVNWDFHLLSIFYLKNDSYLDWLLFFYFIENITLELDVFYQKINA